MLPVVALSWAANAQAQSLTWDPGLTGTGSNGSGTWDNGTTANWSNGSSDVAFGTTNAAVVGVAGGSGAYDISVASAGVTAASLTLAADGTGAYTFNGGKLTIGTTAVTTSLLTVNSSGTFDDTVALDGSTSFATAGQTVTFAGGGAIGSGFTGTTAAIAASSTFNLNGSSTGYTATGAGQPVDIGQAGTLGSTSGLSGGLSINSGATLTTGGSFTAAQGANGLISVNGGTLANSFGFLIVGRSEAATQLGRFVLNSGTVNGATTLIGLSNNTTTGGSEVDINGGTYTQTTYVGINNGGSAGSNILNITGGTSNLATIDLNGGYSAATGGKAILNVSGGALYVGTGGIANLGTGTSTYAVNFSGGTVGANADWSSNLNITLANNTTFQTANAAFASHNITLNGQLSGTGGIIVTGGVTTSALILGGTNIYTGTTEVTSGAELTLDVSTALASASNLVLDDPAASIVDLDFSGADTINALDINGVSIAAGVYTADELNSEFDTQDFTGTGSLDILTSTVPEPSTWALMVSGLGMLFFMGSRRRLNS